MKLDEGIKKIEKYISTVEEAQALFVDVQNRKDLVDIKEHFMVGHNMFLSVDEYCKEDENPCFDSLLNDLSHKTGTIFLTGFTTFLKLLGEHELRRELANLLNMTIAGKVIVLCYQCENFIKMSDPRLRRRICIINGNASEKPRITFVAKNLMLPWNKKVLTGVHKISEVVELHEDDHIYVYTSKLKENYIDSLYLIDSWGKAYDVLTNLSKETKLLDESYGSEEEWNYVLSNFSSDSTWATYFCKELGTNVNLELLAKNWEGFTKKRLWVYFIALKLQETCNNWSLSTAIKEAHSVAQLKRGIFRSLLEIETETPDFWVKYEERKALVKAIGNPIDEVIDYCKIVSIKEEKAVYYLTDNTRQEKELLIKFLDKYSDLYPYEKMVHILEHVYPDLFKYLQPFRFKNELLDYYFQEYKYQKVINRVLPSFEKLVDEQAEKRDFNVMLPSRTEKIEAIDKMDSHLYFVDAMGVEYLGFIMQKCIEKNLLVKVTVCRCELPSLTFCNKEFVEEFKKIGAQVSDVKSLDEIKHKGEENFDYQFTKLPIHLIRELEIVEDVLDKAKMKLAQGDYKRVVLIADHGASRLAVIKENSLNIDVNSKGTHGGRVCEYNDEVAKIKHATHVDDWYVLASYDRFKGGRAASVETHGGATLEEVTIPIIELTYGKMDVEVKNLTPEVTVSFRKKAAIILYSKTKLEKVTVCINGKYYDANPLDDNKYSVELEDIKKVGLYKAKVYVAENIVPSELEFTVKKEGVQEKEIL